MSGAPTAARDAREEALRWPGGVEMEDFKEGSRRLKLPYRRVGFYESCGLPCGAVDSRIRNRAWTTNHYCILPANHEGPCDFIRPCRRSLDRGDGRA